MKIHEFVAQTFGADAVETLNNIRRGGDNNNKGGVFEDFFAVSLICSIAAKNEDLDDYEISAQEYAFVDDLCVRQIASRARTNYQAKNSSGAAAQWTPEIAKRFERQAIVDREFHRAAKSIQVLVVSCPNMAESNRNKIPESARDLFFSQYFPYFESSAQLVLGWPALRENMEILCQSKDASAADSAFKIILGVWRSEQGALKVGEVFRKAKGISKPNLFAGLMPPVDALPTWLTAKCSQFDGVALHIDGGRYVVDYRGFAVSLSAGVKEPEPERLASANTIEQLMMYLMSLAMSELEA